MAWSHQECYLHRQSLLILQFRVILLRKTAFWNTGIGLMVSQLPEVEIGNIERGKEYEMTVKGNTNGSFKVSTFSAFIYWKQNGILDNENEMCRIGFVKGSNGVIRLC